MKAFETHLYNAFEFVAFIVARLIQIFLDAFTHLNWLDSTLALNLYIGLSYACSGGLVVCALLLARRSVHGGALVIGRQTAGILLGAVMLTALAGFTAAAPTTGLSLKYCAKAAADFVRFNSH